MFRFKKIFDELKKECLLKTLGDLTNYFSILLLKKFAELVVEKFLGQR